MKFSETEQISFSGVHPLTSLLDMDNFQNIDKFN